MLCFLTLYFTFYISVLARFPKVRALWGNLKTRSLPLDDGDERRLWTCHDESFTDGDGEEGRQRQIEEPQQEQPEEQEHEQDQVQSRRTTDVSHIYD